MIWRAAHVIALSINLDMERALKNLLNLEQDEETINTCSQHFKIIRDLKNKIVKGSNYPKYKPLLAPTHMETQMLAGICRTQMIVTKYDKQIQKEN